MHIIIASIIIIIIASIIIPRIIRGILSIVKGIIGGLGALLKAAATAAKEDVGEARMPDLRKEMERRLDD